MQYRLLAGLLVALGSSASGLAQEPQVIAVAAPTRLDWAFAAGDFGPEGKNLPNDYNARAQRYQLNMPKDYNANKSWPLVLFISAGAGPAGWNNFRQTCNERDMFFCSPYKAGNGTPAAARMHIILDALDDVRRKYRIDPERTYVAGFSGGGRVACTLAYYLPEYFGGVIPICGTNPPPRLTHLRHRLRDRLSVALVTGETDFNRKENELYMQPFLDELGVRSKVWVAKMGHALPNATVIDEVVGWLEADVKRRRDDVTAWPDLAVAADKTPSSDEQAAAQLRAARAALAKDEQIWRGVALLQGGIARWPGSDGGKQAAALLKQVANDDRLLKHIEVQGAEDEQRFLSAQAKAFERFEQQAKAIEAWQMLAQLYAGTAMGRRAEAEIQRLRNKQ